MAKLTVKDVDLKGKKVLFIFYTQLLYHIFQKFS